MTVATGKEGSMEGTPTEATRAVAPGGGTSMASRLSPEQVWHEIAKASFAVIGYVTPRGEPRSSGVVYKPLGGHLYVAVAPDSWKAKHITASRCVSMTVLVHRGGFLSLVLPIPPATITFHASAIVHPPGSTEMANVIEELGTLLPPERRASATIIEIIPEGSFVTYGVGVSLKKMLDPVAARARVPVR